ncbi:MAG: sigma-70 family RNA polymerase sigma factor [Gemmatimonadaceae bacterium]
MMPHLDAAYTLAFYLTRDKSDAEDVVQEALLRAVRYLRTLRSDATARTWLLTIVRRECYTAFRARRGRAEHAIDDEDEELQMVDPGESPEAAAGRSVLRSHLVAAVDALPELLRETLILREVQDCSYEEIAAITEAPLGTVMSRLSRARARLAAALGGVLDIEELS